MAISSLALRSTNFTINQCCWELRTGSLARAVVLEIGILQFTATVQSLGLGRPQALGVTPVNVLFQMEDPNAPASSMNASLSWGTSPTTPLIFLRRMNTPAAAGVGIVWTFPRGLIVPVSSSLVLFNITAAVASDIWCVLDE